MVVYWAIRVSICRGEQHSRMPLTDDISDHSRRQKSREERDGKEFHLFALSALAEGGRVVMTYRRVTVGRRDVRTMLALCTTRMAARRATGDRWEGKLVMRSHAARGIYQSAPIAFQHAVELLLGMRVPTPFVILISSVNEFTCFQCPEMIDMGKHVYALPTLPIGD
jgi:hypothetical protein